MNGKNKTNKILIGIIICLIAVIIGGAIYFTRGTDKDKENKTPDSAFEPNLDSNASETASNDGNNEEADKPEGIRISINYSSGRYNRHRNESGKSGRKSMLLYI